MELTAPPTSLAAGVPLELGAPRASGGGGAWGDGSRADSVSFVGQGLKGPQSVAWDSKVNEQGKKKTYSSMAKYFLRFNKRQGRSLPPNASFLLRRASKSMRNRPKRPTQGSAPGAEEASR